jgi:beta-N-acetylhexosaminidase
VAPATTEVVVQAAAESGGHLKIPIRSRLNDRMTDLLTPSLQTPDPLALSAEDQAWVERTRDGMSVEDQIAQLFVLSSREDTEEETAGLAALRPGGVHRFPTPDLEQAWRATRRILDAIETPVILSGDIEGGTISYPFATQIANQMGIAACDDLELTRALAEIVALESRALGYNWSFTPVVDVNRAFRNAVVGTRSYGSDVARIVDQARTYVRALQDHGIAASAKHWPGDGIDDRDQHLATTVNSLDVDEWMESFGRIYQALIADGVMTIMSAHISLPAFARLLGAEGREAFRPASISRLLNEDLLRERLGFKGLIVADATVMAGLTGWAAREEAVPAVIENGCDVFLFSRDARADMALMLKGLREGRLSEDRLHIAVTRMLSLKARLGLHRMSPDERLRPLEEVRSELDTAAHRASAREAAGRGLTLVKDAESLLPLTLAKHRRITVIADEGWNFFSGAPKRSFEPLSQALTQRGFELRAFDPAQPPTPADTDLVLYLVGQEATPSLSHIYLDFAKLHQGPRNAMMQFNREIPTVFASFGQPYYLYDAPNISTYVNAYSSLADQQVELARRLVGEAGFTGVSPVDAFCGREQLRW